MGMNLEQKKAVVADVAGSVASAQAAILAEYRGLSVAQVTQLRGNARNAGVYMRVVKNTLAKRAVQGTPFECLQERMTGPVILAASADPVAVAKVLSAFAKDNEALRIMGGAMQGEPLDESQVRALATMPSREELLAKLVGTMQAPIQKFVRTLNEVPASLVRVLAAVRDQHADSQPAL